MKRQIYIFALPWHLVSEKKKKRDARFKPFYCNTIYEAIVYNTSQVILFFYLKLIIPLINSFFS